MASSSPTSLKKTRLSQDRDDGKLKGTLAQTSAEGAREKTKRRGSVRKGGHRKSISISKSSNWKMLRSYNTIQAARLLLGNRSSLMRMKGCELIQLCQERKVAKGDRVLVLPGAREKMDLMVGLVESTHQSELKSRQTMPSSIQKIHQLLQKRPGIVNFRDWDDSTAIMAAARCGAFEVVRYLINHHADLELKNNFAVHRGSVVCLLRSLSPFRGGRDALMIASSTAGNFEVVRELLEGARRRWAREPSKKFRKWLNARDVSGRTALMNACMAARDTQNLLPRSRMESLVYFDLNITVLEADEMSGEERIIKLRKFDTLKKPEDLLVALADKDARLGVEEAVHYKHICFKCKMKPIRGVRFSTNDDTASVCKSCYEHKVEMRDRLNLAQKDSKEIERRYCLLAKNKREQPPKKLDSELTLKQNGVHSSSILMVVPKSVHDRTMRRAERGGMGTRWNTNSILDDTKEHQPHQQSGAHADKKMESRISRSEMVIELLLHARASVRLLDNDYQSAFDFAQDDTYLSLLLMAQRPITREPSQHLEHLLAGMESHFDLSAVIDREAKSQSKARSGKNKYNGHSHLQLGDTTDHGRLGMRNNPAGSLSRDVPAIPEEDNKHLSVDMATKKNGGGSSGSKQRKLHPLGISQNSTPTRSPTSAVELVAPKSTHVAQKPAKRTIKRERKKKIQQDDDLTPSMKQILINSGKIDPPRTRNKLLRPMKEKEIQEKEKKQAKRVAIGKRVTLVVDKT
eukprot:jgi/Bigna1/78360/fgenesh1_pg.54_\